MADDPDIDLSGIVVDFTNAGKLEERVLLICKAAYMAGKLINVDKVGNYLVDHGQTQATLRNAKADVTRVIGNNRDGFKNVWYIVGTGELWQVSQILTARWFPPCPLFQVPHSNQITAPPDFGETPQSSS